ncbi:MAG: 4-deoxy-4-formamido-L-arabinose-phosphoundecaprenol deformylase [Ferrovum sp.]|nr:4-deoxy-4-formamido-L-arabinose-phosphoundecaprenol deformylase [Ferrovum sp.]NDU87067.1 4-deoxy-4-formamido-L-arabinose-phosphoundecaprenol deformylase [Ferrovum sp.]
MRTLALKIDVDTLRGTREGVPALVKLLQQQKAQATFLFSLGPDHTGRALKRVFRKGFLGKVKRTSVLEHYGLKTLLYGTLLPGPDIGRSSTKIMTAVAAAHFEVGVHTWDHTAWQDQLHQRPRTWAQQQIRLAVERFRGIFGQSPVVHGAAGWQMTEDALAMLDEQGFLWSSDCRGIQPFIPLIHQQPARCMQLPTTLPTLDELIGLDGINPTNVAQAILARTAEDPPHGHVFTLHAELEGQRLLPVFQELLEGWRSQGYRFCSLADMAALLDPRALPLCPVIQGTVPGRSGSLAVQGALA